MHENLIKTISTIKYVSKSAFAGAESTCPCRLYTLEDVLEFPSECCGLQVFAGIAGAGSWAPLQFLKSSYLQKADTIFQASRSDHAQCAHTFLY